MLGSSRYAAALSRHADPATATGEVLGQVLEDAGPAPDLAVLFTSHHHLRALDDVVDACSALLAPGTLIGASSGCILAGSEAVEDGPALALWVGRTGRVAPLRLEALPGEPPIVAGLPSGIEPGSTALVLAEAGSFDLDGLVRSLADGSPGVRLAGGAVSSGYGTGQDRLVLDDAVHVDGAVGVVLPPSVPIQVVVGQGARPVGSPWVVTAAEGRMLLELAGRPALARLNEALDGLDPADRALAARGLRLGVVAREHGVVDFGPGDFVVRSVLGADHTRGAIAVTAAVEVGQVVQLHVLDPRTAAVDLERALDDVVDTPGGCLLFTGTGRGAGPSTGADRDVDAVSGSGAPLAGLRCAAELAPVGDRNAAHTASASVVLFD